MYEDTPDTIAQEIKKILYEMQSNNLYLDEDNEYEFIFYIDGIPVCLSILIKCKTDYLIQLSEEVMMGKKRKPIKKFNNNIVNISDYKHLRKKPAQQ